MSDDLQGKRCLIFGASSGIGAAVAERFGQLGVELVIHYRANREGIDTVAQRVREAGGKVSVIAGDLSQGSVGEAMVDEAASRLGGLDIVINNAGSMFGRTRIEDATDAQYSDVLNLNIGGVFFAARRAARIMRTQRDGAIINTTSIAARTGGGDGAGLYGSAKGFVSTLTRVLAKELAPHGVRVNAVAPGVILTPFHEVNSTKEQLAAAVNGIPMGRLGTAEECVGAFEFLASRRMSGYVTGQIIEVNGGQLMP